MVHSVVRACGVLMCLGVARVSWRELDNSTLCIAPPILPIVLGADPGHLEWLEPLEWTKMPAGRDMGGPRHGPSSEALL